MFTVKIKSNSNTLTLQLDDKMLISEFYQKNGITIPMNCGGNHTCGKCKVTILGNACNISKIGEDEKRFLSEAEISDGVRLACFATIIGECTLATNLNLSSFSVQTAFVESSISHADINGNYGIAVDIGTTTVVSYLYSANDGKVLSTVGAINLQSSYGADVISRIDYTNHDEESKLHFTIINQLNEMFENNIASSSKKILPEDIIKIVITGNTAMLHFLMNYPSFGIAVSPFTPHSLFNETHKASLLFNDFTNAELYLPPCIGSYVGADAVCAILASNMAKEQSSDKIQLLADIGTNGEMALFAGGKLFTCSTAAGPAFEGAGIKMGMTAKDGAITDVSLENGKISYKTVGNAKATGICGTGLISALSIFLKLKLVDFSGSIDEEGELSELIEYDENDEPYINIGDSGVILTGRDIRQIQLAKSAIHAGILTLCHECEISIDTVDALYLCGGFGSVIDPFAAGEMGLIPACLSEKSVPLGNGAGLGALMILKSSQALNEARRISDLAVEIPLSSSAYFMEQYVEQMTFNEDI